MTTNLNEVVQFLLGGHTLEGCYFGDIPKTERSQFWWRERLRAAFETHQDTEFKELKRIRAAVAGYYRITEDSLIGRSSARGTTIARQMAMCLSSELTNCTPGEISKAFRRDRSTVATGVPRIRQRMAEDVDLKDQYNEIKKSLEKRT